MPISENTDTDESAHSPQPTPEPHAFDHGSTLPRRAFMQRSAAASAAVTTAAVGGPIALTQPAQATSGIVIGNFTSGIAAFLLGSDDDDDEIEEAEADELHDRIYADALEAEPRIIDYNESGNNDLAFLTEFVRTNVAFAIAEAAQRGDDKEDVIDAAKDEVADTVAGFQERTANRWERDALALSRRWNLVEDEEELSLEDVFVGVTHERGDASETVVDRNSFEAIGDWSDGDDYRSITLVDNSAVEIPHLDDAYPDAALTVDPDFDFDDESVDEEEWVSQIMVRQRGGSSRALVLSASKYHELMVDFVDLYDQEVGHAETLTETLYDPIVNGEIDAHDIASGQAVLEASEDPDHYNEAAGVYRAVAMPEAETPAVVDIEGARLEGILFWTLPSSGGLPIGETIYPDSELGDIYMAAEVVETGDDIGDDLGDDLGEYDVVITVEDDDGEPIEDADVTIDDETETTDEDGEVTLLSVPAEPHTVTIEYDDEETLYTIYVGEDDTEFTLEHTGEDETDDEDTVDDEDEGDVVTLRFRQPFEIVGAHDWDEDSLTFADRELMDPDEDDHEEIVDRLIRAYESEQTTREERQEIIIGDGIDIGLPSFGGDWDDGVGILGLGLIGIVILGVVGIVTDLLPMSRR